MNKEKPIRCERKIGKCDRCGAERMLIFAFDERVYEGGVCHDCFFKGKACDLELEDPLMRPMLFLARALRGDEPFASILRSADSQSMDLEKSAEALKEFAEEAKRQEEILNKAKTQRILRSRGIPTAAIQGNVKKNHKQRRIEAAIARRAARKARKAAKRKAMKQPPG